MFLILKLFDADVSLEFGDIRALREAQAEIRGKLTDDQVTITTDLGRRFQFRGSAVRGMHVSEQPAEDDRVFYSDGVLIKVLGPPVRRFIGAYGASGPLGTSPRPTPLAERGIMVWACDATEDPCTALQQSKEHWEMRPCAQHATLFRTYMPK